MKFLLDAQLPASLARVLAEHGYDADHVVSLGLLTASDQDVLACARQAGWALLTKDEDFARLWARGERRTPVVWLRVGNCSRHELRRWLLPHLPRIVALIEAGETLIEVR